MMTQAIDLKAIMLERSLDELDDARVQQERRRHGSSPPWNQDKDYPADPRAEALHEAAKNGDMEALRAELATFDGDVPEWEEFLDLTLLAVRRCDTTMLEILLEGGVGIPTGGDPHTCALHLAVSMEKGRALAEMLLDYDANPRGEDGQGTSVFMHAVESGRPECLALLARNGVLIDAVDHRGNTALHKAAWRNHGSVVQALLQLGADPEKRNLHGITPIQIAAGAEAEVATMVFQAWKDAITLEAAIIDAPAGPRLRM